MDCVRQKVTESTLTRGNASVLVRGRVKSLRLCFGFGNIFFFA